MMLLGGILRRGVAGGYWHWCPACEQQHPLPENWEFNGDVVRPTFNPSFAQTFFHRTGDQSDRPRGEKRFCHYFIKEGNIQFLPDSWHKRSDIVAMPPLPDDTVDFGCETQD